MTLDTLIMLSGALVAVLPFLGFPNRWDSIFFVVLGIFIISLGIALRRGTRTEGRTHTDAHFADAYPLQRNDALSHADEDKKEI
ncbi:MAG TPA: hypothetical protein VJL39_02100 [Candidatus Paceibacterota bacterium]